MLVNITERNGEAKALAVVAGLTNNSFAQSLIHNLKTKGTLSEKQWFWVYKLAEENTVPLPCIVALFEKALASGLKHPVIKFSGLKLNVFGGASKYRGQIRVMHGGEYAGRISTEGFFGRDTEALGLLVSFESNPAEKAALSGRLEGSCCFCARELSTKESVGVGYGPICADNWALPWGSTSEYEEKKLNALECLE